MRWTLLPRVAMTPPPPADPDLAKAADDFKHGGWVVAILGGAGMLARMLLMDEHHPLIYWIRRILAGTIVGVIAYFAVYPLEMSWFNKAIIFSTAGSGSPELLDYFRRRAVSFLEKHEKENKSIKGRKRK